MSNEFGPWIAHDGKGCPVPKGTWGEAELRDGTVAPFCAETGSTRGGLFVKNSETGSAWVWGSSGMPDDEVVVYRIRKPRGLTILENLIAEIPEEVAG